MLVVAPHVTHKRTEEGMAWMLDLREAHAPLHHACKSERATTAEPSHHYNWTGAEERAS